MLDINPTPVNKHASSLISEGSGLKRPFLTQYLDLNEVGLSFHRAYSPPTARQLGH